MPIRSSERDLDTIAISETILVFAEEGAYLPRRRPRQRWVFAILSVPIIQILALRKTAPIRTRELVFHGGTDAMPNVERWAGAYISKVTEHAVKLGSVADENDSQDTIRLKSQRPKLKWEVVGQPFAKQRTKIDARVEEITPV